MRARTIRAARCATMAACAAFLLPVGCGGDADDDPPIQDAGPDRPETGPPRDGGADAGLPGPLPEPIPCAACGAGQVCVRDACLATCGGDPAVFDAALAPGVAVLANVCHVADAYTPDPTTEGAVFELVVTAAAPVTASVRRFFLGWGNGESPRDPVASTPIALADPTMPFFVGGFLATGPDATRHAFGYTQGFGDPGRVFVLDGDDAEELVAPGNFDAAWLDATTVLLNGQGLAGVAGQGLYAARLDAAGNVVAFRRLLENALDFSGNVAIVDGVVLYGAIAFDAVTFESENALFALTAADVRAVIDAAEDSPAAAPIDAQDDARVVRVADGPSAFVVLDDGRLAVTRFNAEFERLFELRTFTGGAPDAIALGAATPLAGPPGDDPMAFEEVFTGVVPTGVAGSALLVHAGGLLLVELPGT